MNASAELMLSSKDVFKYIPMKGYEIRVGRSAGADIRLNFPNIEAEHFKFVLNDAGWWFQSSLKAISPDALVLRPLVNGRYTEQKLLRHGDRIELSDILLVFRDEHDEKVDDHTIISPVPNDLRLR